jgi:hypothetical protein
MHPYHATQPIASNDYALATSNHSPPAVVHTEMSVYVPYYPVTDHSRRYVAPIQLAHYEWEHIPLGYDDLHAVTWKELPAVGPGYADTSALVPGTTNDGATNMSRHFDVNVEINTHESSFCDSYTCKSILWQSVEALVLITTG